ncbi:MAG TPA: hypothetical protein VEL75_15225 [Candidatus Methylomirabilis sp.]|nr:hypothetical protein [Candidatus Methylomirabilis sp.]
MIAGNWRSVLLGLIAVAAADEQYVIWRSSAVNGFDWVAASSPYSSLDACEEAIQARKKRVARFVDILRRVGADDAVLRAVGDRVYECRPTIAPPPADSFKERGTQAP